VDKERPRRKAVEVMADPESKKRQLASMLVSVLFLISPLLALLVVIPESVSAADAHLDDGGWEWHYDDTNDATKAILTRVVRVGTASTEVNIPTQLVAGINILSIAAGCFYDAEGAKITKVLSMPSTITTIGLNAFRNCVLMTSVIIGSGVTSMGVQGFYQCSALTSITIPNSVTSIENWAFYGCTLMTSVTIGTGVTSIGTNAFEQCTHLTSITIPNNVISIGGTAFGHCTVLVSVTIGSGVTNIGTFAFSYCSALVSITIPNGVTSAGTYLFDHCIKLTSVTIGSGLTSLADDTFQYCSVLASITIPNTITSIGIYAFYQCVALTSVTLGSGTTIIGANAFDRCTALPSITIPSTVTSIGGYAFYYCSALTSIIIPNSVTSLGTYAFDHCTALASVTIGSGVTSLAVQVFSYCSALTSIIIPNGIISIGAYEFYLCTALTSVTIGTGVTTIAIQAFWGCSALTSIKFLGLVAPTSVGAGWITGTPAGIRGHAYAASNFPAPGGTWNTLIMGTILALPPIFTSTALTGAWEDHTYSYSPTCDQTITTWGLETNASWLSQNGGGTVSGMPDNTNSLKSYYVHISATNDNGKVWQNYTVTVANKIPIITTTPGAGVWITRTFYYNASADDGNSYGGTFGSITTNWTGAYSWTASTGKLYFTPTIKGSFWFNISFNDNSGASNGTIHQNFTVTVGKPYYTSNGLTSAWEDHAYSYTPTVNTTVSSWGYATNGSAWIGQNSGTGEVYGTPTNTYSEHSYWVNISASTLDDGTVYQNYSIFVHNYIPHMTTTPDSWIDIGQTYYYNASFDDWSVGGSFSGITSDCPDPYTFNTTTGHLSFDALTLGSYWFDIAFTDNSGAGNESQFQIFYVDVITTTIFTSSPITGAWEDHAYSYAPTCNEAVISWLLETNASWLSQNPSTGAVGGTPTNVYSMQSFYVHIRATTASHGSFWQNYTVTVANYVPHFTTTPGTDTWITKTFYYNASVDDGGAYGGSFGASVITNWTESYSWTASTGKLYFTSNVKGSFWFNISFDDNSGAGNATTYQNFTVTVAKPYFTSAGLTDAWEDHAYSYTPTVNTTVTSWGRTTNGAWINQNSGTGEVYGTPTNTYSEHSYWVNISATTLHDGTIYQNYSIFVHNYVLHFTTTPSTFIYLTTTYSYTASFDDKSLGGSFTGITTNYPKPYSFTLSTGFLTFSANSFGLYWFNITCTDNSGASNQTGYQYFTIDIITITYTSSPVTDAWEDHSYLYSPTCNESVASWILSTNASWLSQNPGTGVVSGTPTNAYSMQSFYVHIKATTASHGWLWQNYTVTVANRAPQFTSSPPTTGIVHVNITYNTNTDDEGVGTPGGNYLGVLTNFTDPYTFDLATGVLIITVLHGGSFWFNITADDQTGAGNATSWQNFTITVAVPSDWGFTSSALTGAWEDHSYSYSPVTNASFIWSWSLTTNATWLSLNSATGRVYGNPNNLYAEQSFSVHLMGSDENYTHWQNFSISVANKAPSFSTTPSTIVWISLIYGYNPTTDDEGIGGYYALVWDLNLSVSFNATTGVITFNAVTAGTYLFNLTFDDDSGAPNATVSQVWSVTVQSVGSGGAGGGGGPPINVDFTFKVNGNTVTFTVVSKLNGSTVQYLWDFGDGSTSTLMNPTHSYAAVGNYTVTLVMGSQYATLGSAKHVVAISELSRVSSFIVLGPTVQIFIPMMLLIGFALAITTRHPLAIIVAAIFLLLTVLFVVVPFLSSIGSVI
jgi:hypothetical protein